MSSETQVDELQENDPWAKPAAKQAKPPVVHIGSPIEDMEQRVLSAVLSQLPKSSMEVDTEGADGRVDRLEQQVQELQSHTQRLHQTVSQHAVDQGCQMKEIRAQVAQQGAHFEAALASHTGQLQTFQETFQDQFRQQSAHQQSMLDSMFQQQMTQF